MSKFGDLYRNIKRNTSNHGARGILKTAKDVGNYAKRPIIGYINSRRAVNIYERDWDVLILLDCATVEMMEEVSDEYDFLNEISDHFSPGTSSSEWMQNTFTDSYAPQMAETLHITSNTSSEYNLSKDDFFALLKMRYSGRLIVSRRPS